MINYLNKDITTVTEGVIGHGCNASGGFGSGVAGAIRKKWPEMYDLYKHHHKHGLLELGTTHYARINRNLLVVNMITQQRYGYDGKKYADEEAIVRTMQNLMLMADMWTLPVYVPKIGCGLGGLDYNDDVEPIFEFMAEKYNIEINVCEI